MPQIKRCAVYTRKSSEEGLEQEFNSLDAQRESCEAYIKSQRHEGWALIPDAYDDGGISGGTMERPALQRLLADVGAGRVDVIVVYKVDRLTRTLSDFARMVEIFDEYDVSFVSVTQQFNTTTSMGRLTLNVLLSFAQFEREVTGERIRDKFLASRKKGMWMGGHPPLGYDVKDRKLVTNRAEAEIVRLIFARFCELKNVRALKAELDDRGITSKRRTSEAGNTFGGNSLTRGAIYKILGNRTYLGEAVHKGTCYPGEHRAIIDRALWDRVHEILDKNRVNQQRRTKAKDPSLLAGLIFDDEGRPLTPSHAVKGDRRYRYYEARRANGTPLRFPAAEIEDSVTVIFLDALKPIIDGRKDIFEDIENAEVTTEIRENAATLAREWPSLSPAEARGLMLKIVDRVTISSGSIDMAISTSGLLKELIGRKKAAGLEIDDGATLVSSTSWHFQRFSNQKRIITTGDQKPRPNTALIRALGKAWGWRRKIEQEGVTIKDIASTENTTPRYVRRLLQLAWLAPDIIEAILDGKQPAGLTLEPFRADQPVAWQAQRALLGFET